MTCKAGKDREHAHWILDGQRMILVNKYKCSNCGERTSALDNYCKNCGCIMDEPVEGMAELKEE